MREILFRGKIVGLNSFAIGFLISKNKIRKYYHGTDYMDFDVIPETVGQYTGLTDKKEVKIFEGDIIKTDDNDIINVSYGMQNIDAFETIGFNLYEFYGNYEDRGKGIRLQSSIEIIGNIHE